MWVVGLIQLHGAIGMSHSFSRKEKSHEKVSYIAALEPYQPNEREESSDVIQVLEVGYSITDFVIATEQILYIYFSI